MVRWDSNRYRRHGIFLCVAAVDEIIYLSPALTDQAYDDDIGDHAVEYLVNQHGFTHPGTGDDRNPLPLTKGQQSVDCPDAHINGLGHAGAALDIALQSGQRISVW